MKKLLKPLGRITLIILIGWIVYGIVELYKGEGAITDIIFPICGIVLMYIIPTFMKSEN
jgi:hypothetical protein